VRWGSVGLGFRTTRGMLSRESRSIPPNLGRSSCGPVRQADREREGTSEEPTQLCRLPATLAARGIPLMPVNPSESRQPRLTLVGRPNLRDGRHDQSEDKLGSSVEILKRLENINSARHILDCYTPNSVDVFHSELLIRSRHAADDVLNSASQVDDKGRLGPGGLVGALIPGSTRQRRLWARRGHECGGLSHQPEDRGVPLSRKQHPRAGTTNLVPCGRR